MKNLKSPASQWINASAGHAQKRNASGIPYGGQRRHKNYKRNKQAQNQKKKPLLTAVIF